MELSIVFFVERSTPYWGKIFVSAVQCSFFLTVIAGDGAILDITGI